MGAIKTIIQDISDDVVAALAAASYPPLTPYSNGTEGNIRVGTEANSENTSPPRIIFEPMGSTFTPPEYFSASTSLATTERRNQKAFRPIFSDALKFKVRCWGASPIADQADDYDVTRALYHQVLASCQKVLKRSFSVSSGEFTDNGNVNRKGREFVFELVIYTPILDALAPYALANNTPAELSVEREKLYAPSNVVADGELTMIRPDGSSETEPL